MPYPTISKLLCAESVQNLMISNFFLKEIVQAVISLKAFCLNNLKILLFYFIFSSCTVQHKKKFKIDKYETLIEAHRIV